MWVTRLLPQMVPEMPALNLLLNVLYVYCWLDSVLNNCACKLQQLIQKACESICKQCLIK